MSSSNELSLALERMRQYSLKMNSLKCVFSASVVKFLGFIIHKNSIQINHKKTKSIKKFLGKLNYLCHIIFNLSEKISVFSTILHFKNETDFTWAEQQVTFDEIKKYLSSPSVIKASKVRIPFWLYIAAEDSVIRIVLMQVTDGKEHILTYLSQCLIDAEIRYLFIKKLYLSLFYACSKLRHYLLSSTCVVVCQANVIKHMLQKLILSGRIGKWAYALIEYDLAYKSQKYMKGQIVTDFIIGHNVNQNKDESFNLVSIRP
jgi:hypothetical protein